MVERGSGNGKPAPYVWAIDEVARDRTTDLGRTLGKLEERTDAHERRLDDLEDSSKRRKGRLDDLVGLLKAIGSVFVTLAAIGGAVLAYLGYVRH